MKTRHPLEGVGDYIRRLDTEVIPFLERETQEEPMRLTLRGATIFNHSKRFLSPNQHARLLEILQVTEQAQEQGLHENQLLEYKRSVNEFDIIMQKSVHYMKGYGKRN